MARTAEIYQVNQADNTRRYAGYARFDNEGNYQGSRGGYGSRAYAKNANRGRGTTDTGVDNPGNGGYRFQGNSGNQASMLQNNINTRTGGSNSRGRGGRGAKNRNTIRRARSRR